MNVAIFGGSFNPPHVAHVLAAAYVLSVCDIEELLVVPCFLHPFGKELASFEDRFTMCVAAMSWLPGARISRLEQELGGPSRTLRTVEHLRSSRPGDSLRLIMGADLLLEARRWLGFDRVVELAPPIVLGRAGLAPAGAPAPLLPDVSSTMIRNSFARGRGETVRELLPRAVFEYVETHGLYRHSSAGS